MGLCKGTLNIERPLGLWINHAAVAEAQAQQGACLPMRAPSNPVTLVAAGLGLAATLWRVRTFRLAPRVFLREEHGGTLPDSHASSH